VSDQPSQPGVQLPDDDRTAVASPPPPEAEAESEPELAREPALEPDRVDHDDGPLPPGIAPYVVPRWIQHVALPLSILALWVLIWAAGSVLLLFVAAAVIALILNPAVGFFQRHLHLPRGLAVPTVYFCFFALLIGAGFALSSPISEQVSKFQKDVPHIIKSANHNLADFQQFLNDKGIHVRIVKQGETALQTLQEKVGAGAGSIVNFGGDLLKTLVTAGFHLILVFVLSIYMLLYGPRIGERVRELMPPGDGSEEDDYPHRVQRAVSGYVRAQFLFSLAMGLGAGVGLYIFGLLGIFPLGRTYAVAFGVFFGLAELVPFVGPFLGALPPVLVALFQDPISALWVALLFLALQQLEGHVVAPQIFGHSLRINPILVIFALLVGGAVAGLIGALIALPTAAVIRETAVYLRRHLVFEPWGNADPLSVIGLTGAPAITVAIRCPQCGAAASAGDAHCRSCGSSLRSQAVASDA
jgi:predicted PurR-regulated permease PerM